MKITFVLVLLLAAIGVYFAFDDRDKPAIELTEEAMQLPARKYDAMDERTQDQNTKELEEKVLYSQTTGDYGRKSQNNSATHMFFENPVNKGISNDIEGEYDTDAIAPEDESVQNVFDDDMQVSDSDALAPEAGTEMMPDGEGDPIVAEPIAGAKSPESRDSGND